MGQPLIFGFVLFAAVTLFTPGPNNIMLMSSGLTYGFRQTRPHIAGVALGFALMVALMGLGLGAIFTAYPALQIVLKYAGAAYLIYLAIMIAVSGPVPDGEAAQGRPMTFVGAALFQWVNVKGWVIALGTITTYAALASYPWNVAVQTLLVLVVGTFSSVTWVLFGTALRPLLTSPRKVRVFNVVMAVLLLGSLYPALADF